MAKQLTPRGKALHWMTTHRGCTEQPAGSNRDQRTDGITTAQRRLGEWLVGQAWCGTWCVNAAMAGGVKPSKPYRWASVAFIEEDAKKQLNGFRGWTTDHKRVIRADLVVLFGRGVHVETVRRIFPRLGLILTDGGNTSSGNKGSQANGGGSYRRWRRFSDVYGYALVNYPGGPR